LTETDRKLPARRRAGQVPLQPVTSRDAAGARSALASVQGTARGNSFPWLNFSSRAAAVYYPGLFVVSPVPVVAPRTPGC